MTFSAPTSPPRPILGHRTRTVCDSVHGDPVKTLIIDWAQRTVYTSSGQASWTFRPTEASGEPTFRPSGHREPSPTPRTLAPACEA
jgi:hypothetical protein